MLLLLLLLFDCISQAVVQEALQRLLQGRTVCVIAHRLSTIQDANRIIVINKGKVVEMGTHEELLAAQGSYAQLVARQVQRSTSSVCLSSSGGGGGGGGRGRRSSSLSGGEGGSLASSGALALDSTE
jgi:ABC-type multidrug transport system ATPase subunit